MIGIISPQFASNRQLRDLATEIDSEIKWTTNPPDDAYILNICENADTIIVGSAKFMHLLDKLPNIKYIAKMGVGTDNLDFQKLNERGIQVFVPPAGINAKSVAELTIRHILTLIRKINQTEYFLNEHGKWCKLEGKELSEITVGIIGYGKIGYQVSNMIRFLNGNVKAYDINPLIVADVIYVELDDLIETSDVITIHINGEGNDNMVDYNFIKKMKKGAYLVNMSRGNIVNIDDMIRAIDEGHLGGAGLDVYPDEPRIDKRLLKTPFITLSCHQGSSTEKTTLEMGKSVIEGIKKMRH